MLTWGFYEAKEGLKEVKTFFSKLEFLVTELYTTPALIPLGFASIALGVILVFDLTF